MIKRFSWLAVAVALYALALLCANAASYMLGRHSLQQGVAIAAEQSAGSPRMLLAQAEAGHGEALEHPVAAEHSEQAEHGEEGHTAHLGTAKVPELPNLVGVVHHAAEGTPLAEGIDKLALTQWGPLGTLNDPMGDPVTALETVFFGFFVVLVLSIFFIVARGKIKISPKQGKLSRMAMFCEIIVLFFEDFFGAIVGKENVRRHLPLIGTLFIYIFACNNIGLLWLGKAPTANLSFNLAMSLVVFGYVHWVSASKSFTGYLKHFPGDYPNPKTLGLGVFSYLLSAFIAVLFTVIHLMEFAIQPLSLSLRLYGNLLGKEVLLGVFGKLLQIPMPAALAEAGFPFFNIPLHIPFLFLGLLLGTIQALIFSLLSAVYITLWEPHDHHEYAHEDAHGHGAHGAAQAGAH